MARKLSPVMKAWLKYGHSCRESLKLKPFKKIPAAKKKLLSACVLKKARMS
jgi:hypothetical protein